MLPLHPLVWCLLALSCIWISGCVNARGTLREARTLVEQVRPEVSLGEVEVDVWRSRDSVEEWHRDAHEYLSFPYVHRILITKRPHFARLGLERALDILIEQRLAADAPQLPAFVVPGEPSTIVARARAAKSLHAMTHELAHIASWRAGYWQMPGPYLWLDRDRVGDPAWIDLDAFIAGWAIEEGTAELTSMAAMERTRPAAEQRNLLERARRSGANALSPGVLGPLVIRTQQFAYGNGLRYVVARGGGEGLDLEERLQAVWASFRGTSREILFPTEPSVPSQLATRLKESLPTLDPRPTAATRFGTFLTFCVLSEPIGYEVAELLPLVGGSRDDLLLSFAGDRHLWITEWTTEEFAREFARRIETHLPGPEVEVAGVRTTVSWDAPEAAKRWWVPAR